MRFPITSIPSEIRLPQLPAAAVKLVFVPGGALFAKRVVIANDFRNGKRKGWREQKTIVSGDVFRDRTADSNYCNSYSIVNVYGGLCGHFGRRVTRLLPIFRYFGFLMGWTMWLYSVYNRYQ